MLAFDSMYEMASVNGKGIVNRTLGRMAGGPGKLEGEAFHQEMFRTARFVDTMLGQPKLGGIVLPVQQQVESSFVFFAARYTRSIFGVASYAMGRGFAPAQARVMLAKMVMGGAATYAGLVYAKGERDGLSQKQILENIKEGLNPLSGKKFMSMQLGGDWFGPGGAYRSIMQLIIGLGDKKNWEFEEYDSKLWDNPVVRGIRTRTTPITGTFMDFMEGEDFLGYPIEIAAMADNPKAFLSYIIDNNAPITFDALLQDMRWSVDTPRFIAEFFGLRTSPETQFEAESAVMDRVSMDIFHEPYESFEHNLLAQDIIKSHPAVQLVTNGPLRRLRPRERDETFDRWDDSRQAIRDTDNERKLELDAFVTGTDQFPDLFEIPQTAGMDGKVYRDEYSKQAASTFNQISGLGTGFGFEFSDEDAPVGSVDAIMSEYFDRDIEEYTDPRTDVVDWDSWFADGDAILGRLPEKWKVPADEFLHKNSTKIKQSFTDKFDEIIKPTGYFRVREAVANQLGQVYGAPVPGAFLETIENQVIKEFTEQGFNTSPFKIGNEVEDILDGLLKLGNGNALSIADQRNLMREDDADLDVELYRQGYVNSLRSVTAQNLIQRYMETDRPRMGYFNAPLAASIQKALDDAGFTR